jgi:hypothetical protein
MSEKRNTAVGEAGEETVSFTVSLPMSLYRVFDDEAKRQSIAMKKHISVGALVRILMREYDANEVFKKLCETALLYDVGEVLKKHGLIIIPATERRESKIFVSQKNKR